MKYDFFSQVRDKVRNLWAHCDFTDWNAVTYADSFQLMTNLVKNLSMSSTDESQALLEMKKWEINGNELIIMGSCLKKN